MYGLRGAFLALAAAQLTDAYSLVNNFDYTNWYSSFSFQNLPDPTSGIVEYVSQATAQSLGLTKIVGNKVYMGVDNNTVLTGSQNRKSIWITSKTNFQHGILIGDFAHIPGTDCGTWPAFWTIREGSGVYGEIDIMESYNDVPQNYMTMHTGNACTFNSPASLQTGTSNNDNYDCSLDSATGVGCSVVGGTNSRGTGFNNAGGGVYAMQWTSSLIRIWQFTRANIPADITAGAPNPANWGLPSANFDSAHGNCNIDSSFPPQTIYFDTDFCGSEAGGQGWSDWSGCPAKTGYSTCEAYVRAVPHAFDDAYWLVNSVKIYQ